MAYECKTCGHTVIAAHARAWHKNTGVTEDNLGGLIAMESDGEICMVLRRSGEVSYEHHRLFYADFYHRKFFTTGFDRDFINVRPMETVSGQSIRDRFEKGELEPLTARTFNKAVVNLKKFFPDRYQHINDFLRELPPEEDSALGMDN